MSEDKNTLRYSLLYSLKEIFLYNKSHNQSDISIFEIGKGYYKEDNEYKEDLKLAVLMSGNYTCDIHKEKVDFYYIKGVLEELMEYLGYANRYRIVESNNLPKEFHPWQSGVIELQGKEIGIIGKLHPNTIKDDIYVLEINLDKVLENKASKMTFKDIPKFPEVKKDMAFIVDKKVNAGELVDVIRKTGGRLLTDIEIFDVYTGEKVKDNEKSIAYSLTFTDNNKTLTDEEVMEVFNKIINEVEKKCNAKLRSI